MRLKWIIIIVVILALLAWGWSRFFKKMGKFNQSNIEFFQNELPPSYSLTHSDSSLFTKVGLERFQVAAILNNKKFPKVILGYFDNYYEVIIVEILPESYGDLRTFVSDTAKIEEFTTGITYKNMSMDRGRIRFLLRRDSIQKLQKINVAFKSPSAKTTEESKSYLEWQQPLGQFLLNIGDGNPAFVIVDELGAKPKYNTTVSLFQNSGKVYLSVLNSMNSKREWNKGELKYLYRLDDGD